jgi:hypothetical protein
VALKRYLTMDAFEVVKKPNSRRTRRLALRNLRGSAINYSMIYAKELAFRL